MNTDDLEQFYNKFLQAAEKYGEASKTGDYKTANSQHTIFKRTFIAAQNNLETATDFYLRLMNEKNPSVRTWASAYSLALNVNTALAENVLKAVSEDDDLDRFIRLDAGFALKIWKDQGFINP